MGNGIGRGVAVLAGAVIAVGCSSPQEPVEVLGVQYDAADQDPSETRTHEVESASEAPTVARRVPVRVAETPSVSLSASPDASDASPSPSEAAVPPSAPAPAPTAAAAAPAPVVEPATPGVHARNALLFDTVDGEVVWSGEISHDRVENTGDGQGDGSPDYFGTASIHTADQGAVVVACVGSVAPDVERLHFAGTATLRMLVDGETVQQLATPVDAVVEPGQVLTVLEFVGQGPLTREEGAAETFDVTCTLELG